MASASPSESVRSWRTAFLTLRDETLAPPSPTTLPNLIRILVFSQSEALVLAARDLPPHEVTSDITLLVELVSSIPEGEEVAGTYVHTCHLIHGVSCHVLLQMKPNSWTFLLDFFEKIVELFLCKADMKTALLGGADGIKAIKEILETLRNCLHLETTKPVKVLIKIVSSLHPELFVSLYSSGNQRHAANNNVARKPKFNDIWEIQTHAFTMIVDAFSRSGSYISEEMWQSTVEVLRKIMDILASKILLVEDYTMSRFYTSLLHCLHLVLSNPKGSILEHVASFVASLQTFFMYGLNNTGPLLLSNSCWKDKEACSSTPNSGLVESSKTDKSPYIPPHLRKMGRTNTQPSKLWNSGRCLDSESSTGFASSDSEHSDSDGPTKESDRYRCSKARIIAILCIQDLCMADPKSLSAHWNILLPTGDVLQPRKYRATLMTCLLFDPILKVRIAAASTLASMLDGPSSVFLQVAEYKEPTKRGSFTTLSSSLGEILMQLHTGLLYLVRNESHSGFLASSFKVLMHLIANTPYTRMPEELLPAVISTVNARILEDFLYKIDHSNLLAAAFSCLVKALSSSPPLPRVADMLQDGVSRGVVGNQSKLNPLHVLLQFSQPALHPTINFEALQVLKAVSHNYPGATSACWEQVSNTVYGLLQEGCSNFPGQEVHSLPWKDDTGNTVRSAVDKCLTAAIKVLDECLRASSGFTGTDDLLDEKLLDPPFVYDCTRRAKVSSAPSYGFDDPDILKGSSSIQSHGVERWCEAIERHLPLTLSHTSSMVRAASITCYAGITSTTFFTLPKTKQDFILASAINAATNDEIPSVRSAACRAIGVIACFPQNFERFQCSAEILDEFIHAVVKNTHDSSISVRITSSWAIANICDSIRYKAKELPLGKKDTDAPKSASGPISELAECALRLTKDGDKVKSNAVRALGNLARFVNFAGYCSWLERMVQAFVSCVTTGNVKVQWNVCHALGNLFLNHTLRLQDMAWAPSIYSILLLLLRDATNFKIRIHAATALAVPTLRIEYGSSFSDVVQGLVHIVENLASDQVLAPSGFKYRLTLEKQLTSTTLHVIGLASSVDPQPLKEYFVKKASFLEEWIKSLCLSLAVEVSDHPDTEDSLENGKDGSASFMQKKAMVSKAIASLLDIYSSGQNQSIARRFENLAGYVS